MVILGIDPGSRQTGYAVIVMSGGHLRRLDGGVLRPPRTDSLGPRLLALHDGISDVIRAVKPDAVAMEECFMGRFARAALVLGHARGALMMAVLTEGVPLFEYAPRLVKMAAAGTGAASKAQLQAMIPRLVQAVPKNISADEADALAVAVCHAHRARPLSRAAATVKVLK
ncbi:crossover junction endodeoxyribonuclease RuvC [Candidatus Eisenbacteria bacterium]|uniref:Crossover junction endodeoxyribonuclease RuvC n=1 Tax=Eiseniibacteriota bacterium TaxID=2212470 RepID=A0ABV6YMB6_UNCEI